MRFVRKQGVFNRALEQSHARPPASAKEATSRWSGFVGKAAIQALLLDEQYHLCCYCELRPDLEGIGAHIEHVQPKSLYPHRTFDYLNLAVSALAANDLQRIGEAVFGGHAKLSEYDSQQFISCHEQSCSKFFSYLSDGRVVPASRLEPSDNDRAVYTIGLLNLNSRFLINRRRRWWAELDQLVADHLAEEQCIRCLAGVDLLPINQRLSPFFSMTRQYFAQVAEEVLSAQAPELLG